MAGARRLSESGMGLNWRRRTSLANGNWRFCWRASPTIATGSKAMEHPRHGTWRRAKRHAISGWMHGNWPRIRWWRAPSSTWMRRLRRTRLAMAERHRLLTRRYFFGKGCAGLGVAALSGLLGEDLRAVVDQGAEGGLPGLPHFPPTAKRVIYLFQSGAPSQMDLFDYKPRLRDLAKTELPESVRMGQRLTGMTSGQSSFPVAPSVFQFRQHGASGAWVSELMPHLALVADDVSFIKSMYTEAINHDPAVTFFQTGFQIAGRPSIGAWLAYGLGSANKELPAFVVMISQGSGNPNDQPLADRQWGSGVLPARYQGVKFRSVGDPVLYLSEPAGFRRQARGRFIDELGR